MTVIRTKPNERMCPLPDGWPHIMFVRNGIGYEAAPIQPEEMAILIERDARLPIPIASLPFYVTQIGDKMAMYPAPDGEYEVSPLRVVVAPECPT